jgi:hypothetical protein
MTLPKTRTFIGFEGVAQTYPFLESGPDLFTDNKSLDKQATAQQSVKEGAFIRSNFKEIQKDGIFVQKSLVSLVNVYLRSKQSYLLQNIISIYFCNKFHRIRFV